jgi:hypothetical protein
LLIFSDTGRRLDWSSKPTKIMPQLCINSVAVKAVVSKRAALLGREIAKGLDKLRAAHKDDLYLGVIARSETQIGRDFDTGKYLGFCALTNAGFSATGPVLGSLELRLQGEEVLVRLQIRVVFADGEQTTERAGELSLRLLHRLDLLRVREVVGVDVDRGRLGAIVEKTGVVGVSFNYRLRPAGVLLPSGRTFSSAI